MRQCDTSTLQHIENGDVIERTGLCVQENNGGQHKNRTDHRVQEELNRGVDAAIMTPNTDEEVHRYQHNFPEHVEKE